MIVFWTGHERFALGTLLTMRLIKFVHARGTKHTVLHLRLFPHAELATNFISVRVTHVRFIFDAVEIDAVVPVL